MIRWSLVVSLLMLVISPALADSAPWMEQLRAIPIQEDGRVMPLDSYAREIAVRVTGRQEWPAGRGPAVYSGREPIELFCDLLFKPDNFAHAPFIAIGDRSFKAAIGLDPDREFFTPVEIASNRGIAEYVDSYSRRRLENPAAFPLRDQKRALDLRFAVDLCNAFSAQSPLPIVPNGEGQAFLHAGIDQGDPGTEAVQAALATFGEAYVRGSDLGAPAIALVGAVESAGQLTPGMARAIRLELFMTDHAPWSKAVIAYALAIIVLGCSRLTARRALVILAVALAAWGIAEHVLGVALRVVILDKPPVSNSYESLLWMGLVAAVLGSIAQLWRRRGWYGFAGITAALASVLIAGLVPFQDQTNALPAVLRSNFWLTIHVLTIVASYGALAVASVLGHVFLIRAAFKGSGDAGATSPSDRSLITQTYRMIQIGLFLLTTGTILGGVWAADSWGRFWGWDPKETWALISIVTYFSVLHARHTGWMRDFGLAASAVLAFITIIWTFYGVNYVMATGLHSYGFGSGGERWVGVCVIVELILVVVCRIRMIAIDQRTD